MSKEYPLQEETYQILGACFDVYNEKGCGFTEPVYSEERSPRITQIDADTIPVGPCQAPSWGNRLQVGQ